MPAKLKDFTMFYKKEGSGEPLILLHGNNESSKIFSQAIKKLAKYYTVYALDSRNHGRSKCDVKKYSYYQMAEDVKEFLEIKKIKSCYIYGFSDGGIIALILTLKYPTLVKALMMSGVNLKPNGLKLSSRIKMFFQEKFSNDLNIRKLNHLMLTQPKIDYKKLILIKCPCLLTIGQKDIIKRKHSLLIKENIKRCQLVIVTKGNHDNYIIENDLIAKLIIEFLDKIKETR